MVCFPQYNTITGDSWVKKKMTDLMFYGSSTLAVCAAYLYIFTKNIALTFRYLRKT